MPVHKVSQPSSSFSSFLTPLLLILSPPKKKEEMFTNGFIIQLFFPFFFHASRGNEGMAQKEKKSIPPSSMKKVGV
jgi:hypothetical protein